MSIANLLVTNDYNLFANTMTLKEGNMSLIGATGLGGPTGSSGPQGLRGLSGATGMVGLQGFVGNTGLQGVSGSLGLTGNTGIQGVSGGLGLMGNTGIQGVSGGLGLTGNTGLVGSTGPAGGQAATSVFFVSNDGVDAFFLSSTPTVFVYDVTYINYGGNMVASTGTYTAPLTGYYYFGSNLVFDNLAIGGVVTAQIAVNGTPIPAIGTYGLQYGGGSADNTLWTNPGATVSMNSGDTATLTVFFNTESTSGGMFVYGDFFGHYIGS